MTITYSAGASARDDVRLLIGDTDTFAAAELRLEDADIDRILVLVAGGSSPGFGGIHRAAAAAADALAAKFSRKAEGSTGPQSIRVSSRAQELRATARQLRQAAAACAIPTAGGLSLSEKDTARDDDDLVQPGFRKGMLDHPEASDGESTDA